MHHTGPCTSGSTLDFDLVTSTLPETPIRMYAKASCVYELCGGTNLPSTLAGFPIQQGWNMVA